MHVVKQRNISNTRQNCLLKASVLFYTFLLIGISCSAESQTPTILSNGLRLIVREKHASPIVAIGLWARAGARQEQKGEEGAAHFVEHMVFKGTQKRAAGETDIAIENLGGTLNASTGPDYVEFNTTVSVNHLEEALGVISDIAMNPSFPEKEMAHERQVILDELSQHHAEPYADLVDALYSVSFPSHPYRHAPGGEPEQIKRMSRDALAAFHSRNYMPDRCTLTIVGDITPEKAKRAAEREFGIWPKRARDAEMITQTVNSHPIAPSREYRLLFRQTEVGVAFFAPAAEEAAISRAAQLLSTFLGDSEEGGWLASQGLTDARVSARYTPRLEGSLFMFTASLPETAPDKKQISAAQQLKRLETLRAGMQRLISGLSQINPSAAELNMAKQRLMGRLIFENETDAGLSRSIAYSDIVKGELPEQFRERLFTVTAKDIKNFIAKYLDPARSITVIFAPDAASSEK